MVPRPLACVSVPIFPYPRCKREAAAAYERAAEMTPTDAEREFLRLGGRTSLD